MISKNFEIIQILSESSNTTTYLAVKIGSNDFIVIKTNEKKYFNDELNDFYTNLQYKKISNESILIPLEMFPYNGSFSYFFPYAKEKSVLEYMIKYYPDGLPENLASKIAFKMLTVIDYLHSNNIIHNDVTLNHFLVFDSDEKNLDIRITGFRFAHILEPDENIISDFRGSPDFAAPEKFLGTPFDYSVDIWSLGVSIFMLINGKLPFPAYKVSPKECKEKILEGKMNFINIRSEKRRDYYDLIQKMCQVEPSKRISIKEALQHPFIMEENYVSQLEMDHHDDLKTYSIDDF